MPHSLPPWKIALEIAAILIVFATIGIGYYFAYKDRRD